ncbi:MAG: hypothetical protein RIC56_15870 [Pseudomonadales bacterium]
MLALDAGFDLAWRIASLRGDLLGCDPHLQRLRKQLGILERQQRPAGGSPERVHDALFLKLCQALSATLLTDVPRGIDPQVGDDLGFSDIQRFGPPKQL